MPRLNGAELRRQCEVRDLTLSMLAQRAGLRRETNSRAANGHLVTEQTLQRIAAVLRRIPVLERDPISAALVAAPASGADQAVPPTNTKARDASTSSRARRNGHRAPGHRVPAEL